MMNRHTKQLIIWAIAAMVGATAGFIYWYHVGCNSGTCSITSSPINSAVYGGVMAILLVNVFDKQKEKPVITKNDQQDDA
jgi:xanthine/uracil permease